MSESKAMPYRVATFRTAGLEAKWSRTRQGAPIIVARWPQGPCRHQRELWYRVDQCMYADMLDIGIVAAYDEHTILADFFSI
jgi:hypothetical protein